MSVNFFYKLTKNPNIKKSFFFIGGGGGLWRGGGVVAGGGEGGRGSEHCVKMFTMALLLLKEYKCAKLF